MGAQKGKLFELAKMYQTYQKKKNIDQPDQKESKTKKEVIATKGQHFDEGKAITLSYNFEMSPEVLRDSHQRQTAAEMGFWASDHSEAFYVEPFEAEYTADVPYREARDEEDDKLEKIVTGFSRRDSEEHEDLTDDEEKLGDMEKKIDKMFEPEDESGAMEAESAVEQFKNVSEEGEVEQPESLSQAIATPEGKEAKSPGYDASDDEFARDIGAILQGQKVYNAEQKKAVGRANTPQANVPEKQEPAPVSSSDEILDPIKNKHKIFEEIAKSMTYANSYDLGAIALEKKFELMDQEIEKEDINKILVDNSGSGESTSQAVEDANVIEEEKPKEEVEAMGFGDDKYNPQVPLSNLNGGRLIKGDDLQKGDLILASSSGGTFGIIDGTQGSESIAGLYLGNKKILTKGDGGSLDEKAFDPDPVNKGVLVALRHQNITAEKSSAIVDALTKLRVVGGKNQAEPWIKINIPTVSIHADVCNLVPASDKNKCSSFAGKIYLGTAGNDSFLCAESIINSFEKNGVGFVPALTKDHNGSLKYFGHLKNK